MAKVGDFTLSFLSQSTSGRQIKITGTNTAGSVLLHTAVAGAASLDVVTLEAVNTSGSAVTLTIEWGGVTSPDDLITTSLPANSGIVVVVDRKRINGGLLVKAFASTANVVLVSGDVDTYVISA